MIIQMLDIKIIQMLTDRIIQISNIKIVQMLTGRIIQNIVG